MLRRYEILLDFSSILTQKVDFGTENDLETIFLVRILGNMSLCYMSHRSMKDHLFFHGYSFSFPNTSYWVESLFDTTFSNFRHI